MPNPRNRLHWNAACKVYPAISDLDAIEEVIRWSYRQDGVSGVITLDTGAVPAGKLWVCTWAMSYILNGTLARMDHIIRNGVTEDYVNTLDTVTQGVPLLTDHIIVMKPDEYFRFVFMTVDIVARVLAATFRAYQIDQY